MISFYRETLNILDQQILSNRKYLENIVRLRTGSLKNERKAGGSHILIVTTWRSGSTFFSEILARHPNVFLHYEPLFHMGVRQIRYGQDANDAVHHLENLNHCR